MSVVTTPAVLLRSLDYSETSRILRFYTLDLGLVGVMAKGVRRANAKGQGALQTFARGDVTLYVRPNRDLQTLKEFAARTSGRGFAQNVLRFAAASVLAELVLVHAGSEASPEVFERLTTGLQRLESEDEEGLIAVLLVEGWGLVAALGYRPQLESCVHCGRTLQGGDVGRFDFDAGGVRCPECSVDVGGPLVGPGARDQLLGLIEEGRSETLTKPRAHLQLLHDFTLYHLSGSKPLRSFRFLGSVVDFENDAVMEEGA